MVKAVLSIQLPRSPDEIRSMINDIRNLFSHTTKFQDNLKDMEKDAEAAQELLQKSRELRSRLPQENWENCFSTRWLLWSPHLSITDCQSLYTWQKSHFILFFCREQTKEIDVKEINRVIFEADEAQTKANDDLETASRNIDEAKDQIQDVKYLQYVRCFRYELSCLPSTVVTCLLCHVSDWSHIGWHWGKNDESFWRPAERGWDCE